MKHIQTQSIFGLSLLCLTVLGGCTSNRLDETYMMRPSMFEDSYITQRQIQLNQSMQEHHINAKDMNAQIARAMADDYNHHGVTPADVVVTYNATNASQKSQAKNMANIVKGQLAKQGVTVTSARAVPVTDIADSTITVSYVAVHASGPDDCGVMPGLRAETGSYKPYGMGCTLKDQIAMQVAYPSDLMGADGVDMADADRAGAMVNGYRTHEGAQPFQPSYVLSDLAGKTTE